MNEQDKPKLKAVMNRVAVITDKAMTADHYSTYFDLLSAYAIEQVEAAFNQALRSNTFFPRPAELIELLEGSHDDRAGQSWHVLQEAISDGGNASVKFLDPAAAMAVDVTFGGYLAAARLIREADEPMVAHYRKNYVQAYQTARKFPREVETYRAGVFEFQNSGGGDWSSRMTTFTGPVRLLGLREMKEVRLPFDAATGTLTDESRLMIEAARTDEGARRLLAAGITKAPKMLAAASSEPVSHHEAKKLLKAVQEETGIALVKEIPAIEETEEQYQARVQRYRDGLLGKEVAA